MSAGERTTPVPGKAATWLARVAKVVLLAGLFALSSVVSVLLHSNVPVTRQAAADLGTWLLMDAFYGRLRTSAPTALSLDRLELPVVTVLDERGNEVIRAHHVRIELGGWENLERWLLSSDKLTIALPHARIEDAHVAILADPITGEPTLVRALTPRPGRPRAKATTPGREVRVFFPVLELGSVTAEAGAFLEWKPTLRGVQSQLLVTSKGVALDVHRLAANVQGILGQELAGTGTLKLRAPGQTQARFSGFLAELEVEAAATIEGKRVEVDVRSQAAHPEAMRRLFGTWPFHKPVSARVSGSGELPALVVEAEVATEESRVTLTGPVELSPRFSAEWTITAKDIDANGLDPRAPRTRLNGAANLRLRATNSAEHPLSLSLAGRTEATVIESNPVPALDFELEYEAGNVSGEVNVHEPDMPFTAAVAGKRVGAAQVSVEVPRFRLEKSQRIPKGARGLLALEAELETREAELVLSAKGRLEHFRLGDFQADRIDFGGSTKGQLAALKDGVFQVTASANNARYGVVHYDRVRASATGTRKRARVQATLGDDDGRSLVVAGDVFANGRVRDVSLEARRQGLVIVAKVAHADPSVPAIEVSRVTVQGLNSELAGKVRYRPGLLEGELAANNVDLGRLAAAFGLPASAVAGTLESDSNFVLGQDLSRASLHVGLTNASFEHWGRVELALDATLRERAVEGSLKGADAGTGILLNATFGATLAGHALELESYRAATGSAEVSVNNVRLAGLDLALDSERVSDVDGLVGVRARLTRDQGEGWPSALVELGAQNLAAKVKVGDRVRSVSDLASYNSFMFNARDERIFGSGMVADPDGPLLTLTAALGIDPDAVVADPRAALRTFQETPINVVLNVARRNLDAFPLVEPNDVPNGAFGGQLTLFGTPKEPRLSALFDLADVSLRGSRTRPVSFKLSAQYTPIAGELSAAVQGVADGRSVVLGKVTGAVPLSALTGSAPWQADAKVALDRFPLDLIPGLERTQLGGSATGTLELNQRDTAELVAHVDLQDLGVGRTPLGTGTLQLKGGPGQLLANFVLVDHGRSLNVRMLALGADPGNLPLPHRIQSVGISLDARRMNAAALSPILRDAVARLRGNLDAKLTWFVERVEDGRWQSRLEGDAHLHDGTGYVDALGIELHDVNAELTARPAGERTLIRMTTLTAKARTTVVNLEGSGQVYLEGTQLVAGDARVLLRSVPLTFQGLSLGKASGRAECTLERVAGWDVPGPHQGKDYLVVNIDIDHWNMKAARSVSRQLIDTRDNPDVIVLQTQTPREVRADLVPYRIFITLREDVRFGFGDISLPLEGEAVIDYDGASQVNGQLRLRPGSRLPILGKRFDVLAGTIQLDPKNLGNPGLDLALSGTTPEGNVVQLTVGGTLREPVLDPPPSELQALLGGGTATLLGGGVQALGLNELLGESVGAVELRVEAGDEAEDDPSYAAAVQIGPDLWFEGGYQRAQDSGLNQNQSDVFSGSVDYRFHKKWSLKTRLGNAGGGVDVLWQHRY